MKILFDSVNDMAVTKGSKIRIYLILNIIIFALAGGAVWGLIGRFFFTGTGYLFCFMGYPAVFAGFFLGALYLSNHDFS